MLKVINSEVGCINGLITSKDIKRDGSFSRMVFCRITGTLFENRSNVGAYWHRQLMLYSYFLAIRLFFVSRNQAEESHTCRGTINLANAFIHTEDSCSFVVSNGGTQTFHLKANSEVERQKWVTALELAKSKAVAMIESGMLMFVVLSALQN